MTWGEYVYNGPLWPGVACEPQQSTARCFLGRPISRMQWNSQSQNKNKIWVTVVPSFDYKGPCWSSVEIPKVKCRPFKTATCKGLKFGQEHAYPLTRPYFSFQNVPTPSP